VLLQSTLVIQGASQRPPCSAVKKRVPSVRDGQVRSNRSDRLPLELACVAFDCIDELRGSRIKRSCGKLEALMLPEPTDLLRKPLDLIAELSCAVFHRFVRLFGSCQPRLHMQNQEHEGGPGAHTESRCSQTAQSNEGIAA
jgi:hypothetical protein